MATYREKRGTNTVPIVSSVPDSGVNGEIVYITGEGLASYNDGTWSKLTATVPVTDWSAATQQAKLQASDPTANAYYSSLKGLDIDGDTVAAGAYGLNTKRGALYVHIRSGTSWSQQAKLTASDPEDNSYFGERVALDTDTIVVGARRKDTGGTDAGVAYVFIRSGTSWSQQTILTASDAAASDNFGHSVAISGDTIIVGANNEQGSTSGNAGAVYVFTRSGTTWSQEAKITPSDTAAGQEFGHDIAIEGNTLVAASKTEIPTTGGAVYVFTRSGTTWSQEAKVVPSDAQSNDAFGDSVSLSSDTLIVGSSKEDTTADAAGSAYIFTRSGTSWSQQAKIQASDAEADDEFGADASIEGDIAVVGTWNENSRHGAAYIFTRSGTSWTQTKKLASSDLQDDDQFGRSVRISGSTIAVGAPFEDTGADKAGSAYTFIPG